MNNSIKYIVLCSLMVCTISCNNERTRQIQYMGDTDMYNAVPYETYSSNPFFKDSLSAQLPVEGTIARGHTVYDEYPNTEEGYQAAKDSLRSPLWVKKESDSVYSVPEKDLDNGRYMYDIYCAICHGTAGDGQGDLVKNEKFLGVPNYKDREITEGSIYHVIMYGRGLMGSHASQLTEKERWQVVHYVEQLRNELLTQ